MTFESDILPQSNFHAFLQKIVNCVQTYVKKNMANPKDISANDN